MKYVITILLIILPFFSFAIGPKEKIVELEGVSKDEIYKRALLFITKEFKSAKDVIQLQDKEEGRIIGKGALLYNAAPFNPGLNYSGHFFFTVTIECKDGKYRYVIDQIRHEATLPSYTVDLRNTRKRKITEAAETNINDFTRLLERSMLQSSKLGDW